MVDIKRLDASNENFWQELEALLAWESVSDDAVFTAVKEIIHGVRHRGDEAVIEYTNRFDRMSVASMAELEIPMTRVKAALETIPSEQREALEYSAKRLKDYHQRQKQDSWSYTEADGTMLGQQVTPLDRVGLYVPGGKAAYPSSVLMNAISANVAGVEELIMVVPTPDGVVNDLVLAAAAVSNVDRVFAIGGAQAVAALAYGILFVLPIGGADMPVVISLLNSFTGLAAALGGFLYGNMVMLTGGILVGSAGTILTFAMCDAMNRSLVNVIFGSFGGGDMQPGEGGSEAITGSKGLPIYYICSRTF